MEEVIFFTNHVLCGFKNKQRISPYTIRTLGFSNRDGACLLRGTDWVPKYSSGYV